MSGEYARDARASPPVMSAILHSPFAILFAASSKSFPGLSPPWSEYLFHFTPFSTPSFSARRPGRSGYGHVQVLTTSMLSIAAWSSDVDDEEASLIASCMASSINVAGSLASAMAVERFLMSPTPIMTGTKAIFGFRGLRIL
jgi:hypothetical protein